ncbi:uncharacterized protein PHALS_12928 [Plasmopara halstedii]|uniref:Uncharacterized protein n=1 Tax=Plasmopara halstedii TaxID=4781 RepID=A0A0P1ANH6_PLAHL|nr:uncharacterized protein PHALS_12928 [Plasmopara halstedii]CEG42672.1 hypothetical protein PHALS_12928 [Plasmopara halstedii]|eukprot:XP_024579041.1 hypothetical protein PHALS_12928 [Plasmopara halstedii]
MWAYKMRMFLTAKGLWRKAKFSGVDDESVSGLESALFRTWHGLSELAVWNRLQFGNDAVEALTSGKVEIADKYFTQKNTDGQFFAISRLENNFGEMGVTVALATAKLEPATKEFATMMQHKQIRCWVQYEASVDLVFTSLHFKMDGDINLNVKLEALSSFISLKNRAQPYVKAGDLWGLASLAVKANAGDDPAQLLQHADKILHLVFAKWKSESLRPKELFNQFHGKTLPADLFDSAIVLQYSDFYKDYNSMVIPSFTKPRRS